MARQSPNLFPGTLRLPAPLPPCCLSLEGHGAPCIIPGFLGSSCHPIVTRAFSLTARTPDWLASSWEETPPSLGTEWQAAQALGWFLLSLPIQS